MRKRITYVIIIFALCAQGPFFQFARLPLLGIHYLNHVDRDPGMGIVEYLKIHYWGKDINDKDSKQDAELPFKGSLIQQAAFLATIPPELPVSITSLVIQKNSKGYCFSELAGHRQSLFHPPKV